MTPLPAAHGPFIAIEIGNWLLTVVCLVVAWRNSRALFGLMIGSTFLGYALEYSQTTKVPPPYAYTEAIIALPGNIPLGIVLSWGMILFAVWHAIGSLEFGWLRHSLAGGLLAVMLDFVTDPAFVYLDFWVWDLPTQYFGIPFSNFVGWFVIVTAFFASLRCAFHFFPPEKRSALFVVALSLICIVPAFLSFVGIMLLYEILLNKGPAWLTEPRLVILYLVPAAAYVLLGVAQRRHVAPTRVLTSAVDQMTLVVPGYLLAASAATLLFTKMMSSYAQLAIVYPVFIVVVIAGFSWPLAHRVNTSS